jgi:hypothetical protein
MCRIHARSFGTLTANPAGYKVVPCDACVDDFVPKNIELFIISGGTAKNYSPFAIFSDQVKPADPLFGRFTFPYELESTHTWYSASGYVTKKIKFSRYSVFGFVEECRQEGAEIICEYKANDISQADLNASGCLMAANADGTLESASAYYCTRKTEIAELLASNPGVTAVRYCNDLDPTVCFLAYGANPSPLWVKFNLSGRRHEHWIMP